jgi:hypothetical protein
MFFGMFHRGFALSRAFKVQWQKGTIRKDFCWGNFVLYSRSNLPSFAALLRLLVLFGRASECTIGEPA